jgi:hypothetical protein
MLSESPRYYGEFTERSAAPPREASAGGAGPSQGPDLTKLAVTSRVSESWSRSDVTT